MGFLDYTMNYISCRKGRLTYGVLLSGPFYTEHLAASLPNTFLALVSHSSSGNEAPNPGRVSALLSRLGRARQHTGMRR